jgi:hypothetical protein
MQNKRSYVGPRGWAMLVLVGGATFASPFLRAPRVEVGEDISESPLAYHTRPDGKLSEVSFSRQVSSPAGDGMVSPASSSRQATDPNQLESPPTLPAWAAPRSRLDDLISMGAAPPWEDETPSGDLAPLQPWMERQLGARERPSTQAGFQRDANQPFVSAPPTSPFDKSWDGSNPLSPPPSDLAQQSQPSWPQVVPMPAAQQPLLPPAMTPAALSRPAPTAGRTSGYASFADEDAPDTTAPKASPVERRFVFQPGMKQPQ